MLAISASDNDDDHAEYSEARPNQHVLCFFSGTRGALRGDQQSTTGGCLQLLLSADDQCGTVVQKVAARRSVGRVEFLDLVAQLDGFGEVLTQSDRPTRARATSAARSRLRANTAANSFSSRAPEPCGPVPARSVVATVDNSASDRRAKT